jgi:hypothetical protein
MDDPEVEVMLGLIMRTFFFGIYEDCLVMLQELCLKVKCKKGIAYLKKIHPLMHFLGNDTFGLMHHKYIKLNTPTGMVMLKRMELKKIVIDTKSYMIQALLALLEEHPVSTPEILQQVNALRGQNIGGGMK